MNDELYVPPPRRVTETDVEGHLKDRVEEMGGIAKKWYARGNKGVHDRICIFPMDNIWLVEAKAPDGSKSRGQKEFHNKLWGDLVCTRSVTVWCKDDVEVWLRIALPELDRPLPRNLITPIWEVPYELMMGRLRYSK